MLQFSSDSYSGPRSRLDEDALAPFPHCPESGFLSLFLKLHIVTRLLTKAPQYPTVAQSDKR